MPKLTPMRLAPVLAFAALVGVAVLLSGCVSDSAGAAFGPTPTATEFATPTVTPLPTIPPNQPAAVVAGTPIPGREYAQGVKQAQTATAYQASQQPGTPPQTEQQIRSAVISNLIVARVAGIYAASHGISVTNAEIQSQYDQIAAQYGGPISFTVTLKNFGFTPATFRERIRDSLIINKVEQKVTPLPATVEQVQARHILVNTKAQADKLYAQLQKDPKQFAALAKKYSKDTGSAAQGGELGFFGPGQMVAPFEKAAFSQPIGVIGKPVKSSYGYHIILVEARRKVPFAQLDQTTQQTYQQKQQSAFTNWLTKERKALHVKILAKGVTAQ